ncbi:hypothetical protein P170DRAFT_465950 [Aspergillus steynii IBT 23096]|uniref:Zn(2)-C6 fungal-type domain-containing protein n=1 Tax=Aspergillus steynii IBT 23096 TaxID=1392250 RepID=A0A2I2G0M1_9EURO|nr:uncharacterized protein P170DRAFT_465950 [Aspergillus steynii IBT 23096]PLB46427.1 hypothetical protein P170DRAFT_465950 [Aspergillus steynii IBT 23096]
MAENRTDPPLAPAGNPSKLPAPRPLVAKPARKNSSLACSECREKKTKCIGGVPCTKCRERKTECIVNEASDKRRKLDLKRKIQSLEHDRDLLFQLVSTLRTDENRNASDVLNLIRSNASLDEIRLSLAESLNPQDPQTRAEGLGRNTRQKYMDINRLSDIPRWRVSARPWTTVTDDDDLVSHLISLYFSWNHQILNWIDRDLFIRDMQSGNVDSQFCSPLLVNAVLAMSCFYSEYPEVLATPGDPSSSGVHFYNEAKQLLEKEEGRLRLTTLQATGDIYVMTCVMGKDRLGWKLLVDIADSVREFQSKRNRLISDAGEQSEEMRLAIDKTILGLFNLEPTSTLSLQKPPVMKKPDIKRLPEDHHPADVWVPYPLQEDPRPAHTNCVINALYDLQVIAWDIANYFFGDKESENNGMPPYSELERIIDEFYGRLQNWANNVSECVSLGHTPNPGAIDLHMRYHVTIMTLFGYLKGHPEAAESSFESIRQGQAIRIKSAHGMSDLLSILRSQYPMICMPLNCMHFSTVALFTLFEDLDNPENSRAFVNACISLRGLARRWVLAKGMLRLVQVTALQQEINLPEETRSLFRDFEAESWKVKDYTQFSSLYPNFAVTVHGNPGSLESAELDRFLEKWDNMTLSAETSETTTPESDRKDT